LPFDRVLVDGDDFLILASDGLWDTMSNQETVDIVARCADKMGLQACAELLTATSIRKGSMDNTSVILVDIRGHRMPRPQTQASFAAHLYSGSSSSGQSSALQPHATVSERLSMNSALAVKESESRRHSLESYSIAQRQHQPQPPQLQMHMSQLQEQQTAQPRTRL
jgi:hypothetical protein